MTLILNQVSAERLKLSTAISSINGVYLLVECFMAATSVFFDEKIYLPYGTKTHQADYIILHVVGLARLAIKQKGHRTASAYEAKGEVK